MSSIQKRPDGRWRARYRDDTGREHARHFDRKLDGQRWLDEVTASIVTGQYVDPKAGRITFRQYATDWLAAQVHRESTAALYARHLERHAYPVLGKKPLTTILPSTVQGWVKGLGVDTEDRKALSPATVGVVYTVVASIFRAAVKDRKIAASPCNGITLPKAPKARVEPMTTAQVEILKASLPDPLKALVVLVAGTGLRQGEGLGLTRDRLRLLGKNPAVTIDRQLVTGKGGTASFGPVKTEASNRVVPLPRVVVAALNDHIARYGIGDGELLFTLDGKPITRQRLGHAWRPAATAAKLTEATGTGMHALRHYYASLLIRYGESVKVVQSRLGHASAAETLDTYSHLWPDSNDRTREAVDSVLVYGASSSSNRDHLAGAAADSPRTDARS